ncbi:MAG: alpha/beta fold hydrolase [Pseudomonadota bacterium]
MSRVEMISGPVGVAGAALKVVRVPAGDATYLEAGDGHARRVLLLHGGGLDGPALSWRLLIPELAERFHVIAPHWPGHGGSTPFGRPYTIADLGQWLMTLMDQLEIERAALSGVSMGGGAALWAALRRPERVDALIPVASYGVAARAPYHPLSYLLTKLPLNALAFAWMRRRPSALRAAVRALFADPTRVTPDLLSDVAAALEAAGGGAAFTHFQRGEMTPASLRTVFVDELAALAQPTLFIHGVRDALVPLTAAQAAADAAPNARLELLDAGHWPMREAPEAFNALVRAFLDDPGGA